MSEPLQPRAAVQKMAAYSPPTAGREGKLRLDFNENTEGCSPRVAEVLREKISAERLAIYPEYVEARARLAEHFGVAEEQMLFSNGTDEAIQVLLNTFVEADAEVIILQPSYAMYRFYAELAGARITTVDYRAETLAFPLEELLAAITPATRAILISNPNNPTGTAADLATIEQILQRAPERRGSDRRSLLRVLRHHRAAVDRALPESLRQPHLLESLRHGGDAFRLPLLRRAQPRLRAQSAVALQRELARRRGRARRSR